MLGLKRGNKGQGAGNYGISVSNLSHCNNNTHSLISSLFFS